MTARGFGGSNGGTVPLLDLEERWESAVNS